MSDVVGFAETERDYEEFGLLIREYWEWLRGRYPTLIDAVGSHQGLEVELRTLRTVYGPPRGRTLLARGDHEIVGGIAYRDLGDGVCEMKRLFVPVAHQGHGTGRQLCEALIAAATADGFALMRLDTGVRNAEAIKMYESIGFRRSAPYHDYGADLMPHMVFMELPLGADPP